VSPQLIGLTSFLYSFNWLLQNPNPISSAYGWHFQYLTIIGLLMALFTFLSGLISDLTGSTLFFRVKNILSICSAPLECLISTLYWGIRAVDPSLVVPKELELPLNVDLSFHLAPAVFLLVDLLFFSPPWAIGFVPALGLSTVIAVGYWGWIEGECLCVLVRGER
jgi:FAR-17a/AIG1-like protein